MSVRSLAIDERLVVGIWERQAFDLAALARLGFEVVFRGVPSDAGGPDYQDAIFSTPNASLVRGDVEFHVRSSDWYHHGHAVDPRYNGVQLHVVWQDDAGCTRRQDGVVVPVLELHSVAEPLAPVHAGSPSRLAPHACIATFAGFDANELTRGTALLGWMRFQEREDRFAAELELAAPDQVLYAALLEGMGYASNRQTFLRLAEAIPFSWLVGVPVTDRAAVLLDAAGLGPGTRVALPARLPPNSWRLSRLRPGNAPALRIRGALCLLERLGPSPANALADVVAAATKPVDVRERLMARVDGEVCVGAGRADELAASVVLPFIAALDSSLPGPRSLFSRYPSPPATRWTRIMIDLMSQAGHRVTVKTALDHQALHLLYTRFCRKEGSADCPLCGSSRGRVHSGEGGRPGAVQGPCRD